MTEQQRPLPSAPDHTQGSSTVPEDEISLVDLLEVLLKKKVLILVTTAVFALGAIFYAFSIAPTYEAKIGFLPPEEANWAAYFPDSFSDNLPGKTTYNEDGKVVSKNKSLFYKFLTVVQSYRHQEKVFMEGNFLKRFVDGNPEIGIGREVVHGLNKSIQINEDKKESSENSFDETIYLEMVGTKPEAMSDYLNALAESAKNEVVNSTKELLRKEVEAQIHNYSITLENLRARAQTERLYEIDRFSGNLEIAKNLGIVGNSFGSPTSSTPPAFIFPKDQEFMVQKDQELPLWYLYGQRALEQELKFRKNQDLSNKYLKETAELDAEIASLSRIDLSKMSFKPVIISQPSIPPSAPIAPNKIKIIAIGIVLGLLVGLLGAFFSHVRDQLREKEKLSVSKE